MNQDELRKRTMIFVETLHLPISRFARVIGFERGTYYKWVKGELNFGEQKCLLIDEYLKRFGF